MSLDVVYQSHYNRIVDIHKSVYICSKVAIIIMMTTQ